MNIRTVTVIGANGTMGCYVRQRKSVHGFSNGGKISGGS